MTWESMTQFERDCWAVEKVLGGVLDESYGSGTPESPIAVYSAGGGSLMAIADEWHGRQQDWFSVTRWECDGQVMKAAAEKCDAFIPWLAGILCHRAGIIDEIKPQMGVELDMLPFYRVGMFAHAAYLAMEGES